MKQKNHLEGVGHIKNQKKDKITTKESKREIDREREKEKEREK